MKAIQLIIAFSLLSFFAIGQDDTIHNFKKDDTIKFIVPRQKHTLLEKNFKPNQNPQKPLLNGQQVLYNTKRQKTKEGFFKDNRFMDGKNYQYDENGKLTRIEIYKDGVYVGDAPIK